MFNKNLYNAQYHEEDISHKNFLITGGAGFIGSNLVEYLLKYGAGHVRVLDDLSNGYYDNIKNFIGLRNFEFIQGDICDLDVCKKAVEGMNFVSHQAALGSVPRSISDPIRTNEVNIKGFLNILSASKDSKDLDRFVYAASSSSYGDSSELPKIEGREGSPLSPYAVTKLVNELYAEVFYKVYDFKTIGLRYFNVFGPKQNPNNPYAAVIPLFTHQLIHGIQPTVFGDGETSRDFTFVENVVQANIRALFNSHLARHNVYNIACGEQTSLNNLIDMIGDILDIKTRPYFKEERLGDVKHSLASVEKAHKDFAYIPHIKLRQGLEITLNGIKKHV